MRETIRLMLTVAEQRMEAASTLTHSTQTRYASGALLRALSMELLLKTALLASGKRYAERQGCADLWDELPMQVKDQIMAVARQENDDLMILEPVKRVFDAYDDVIKASRYPVEEIEAWSSAEDQAALRENYRLLASETPSAFSLEGGRLAAGLAAYVEETLREPDQGSGN
jgi:HEPN domain-containing protein